MGRTGPTGLMWLVRVTRTSGLMWRAAGLGALAILAAGCGTGSSSTHAQSAAAAAPGATPPALSLTTSMQTTGATWATVPMGAAAGPNEFWQLFMLPAGSQHWSLRTPPDIATNGALILAGPGGAGAAGATLTTGVRPSLDLGFSPITSTSDGGRSWATSPPQPGLANVPDALAAAPGGQLIALGRGGAVNAAASARAAWTTLTSEHALAATPAARGCGLTGLTAAAYTPAGSPLLAGTCRRAGTVGVFADSGHGWQPAGPALPASLSGQRVQVLRLSRTSGQDVALLEAGTAPSASLLAAWTGDGGQHWTLSPALRLAGDAVQSASFGDGGVAVALDGGRGQAIAGPGASWRRLPTLPAGRTITLALPGAGVTDALAGNGGTMTAWQLGRGSVNWAKAESIKVPIQYGSSSGS